MVIWPDTLPLPQRAGYQLTPTDPTVRTDMEVGSSRVRRRTFARADRISLRWWFTDTQMAVFRSWFDQQAAGAWFSGLPLATGDGEVVATEARFVGAFTQSLLPSLKWEVSAELELR